MAMSRKTHFLSKVTAPVKLSIRCCFLLMGQDGLIQLFQAIKPFHRISNMKTKGWCYTFAFPITGVMGSTLPPTLYNHFHITTSDYSKVLRGLRGQVGLIQLVQANRHSRPAEGLLNMHRTLSSLGINPGQWRSR